IGLFTFCFFNWTCFDTKIIYTIKKVDRIIMSFNSSEQIMKAAIETGEKKAKLTPTSTLILGFLAGTYISFGFLLYIRITANLPQHIWGTLPEFIGAALFPLGLILVLVAGGELVTGNMMALTIARLSKKINTWDIV